MINNMNIKQTVTALMITRETIGVALNKYNREETESPVMQSRDKFASYLHV